MGRQARRSNKVIMKKWLIIGGILLIMAMAGFISYQQDRISKLKNEVRIKSNNEAVLLGENEMYRVNDSLKAISTGVLTLRISDYERYRSEDAAVISQLRGKLKNAETIISLQSMTIREFEGMAADTVIKWNDRPPELGKRMEASDQWGSVWCELLGDEFKAGYSSVDSLYAKRHIEYQKRFLWWKWKPQERWEFLNANPNNTILGGEVIDIRK